MVLLRAGADVKLRDDPYEYTVLHHAAKGGYCDILQKILQAVIDLDGTGGTSITASSAPSPSTNAHSSYLSPPTEPVSLSALIHAIDHAGHTALHLGGASSGNPEVVSVLLRWGADPGTLSDRGESAALYAAHASNYDVLQYLLSHPSCPVGIEDWRDCDGNSIQSLSLEDSEIDRILVETGRTGRITLHL